MADFDPRVLPMRSLLLAAACLVAGLPALAMAWTEPAAAMPPKPARLGLCAACHGETGMAQIPGAPNLAGQRLDYLRVALRHYRDGSRDVAVMRAAIGPVSDDELDALARWYSAQAPAVEHP